MFTSGRADASPLKHVIKHLRGEVHLFSRELDAASFDAAAHQAHVSLTGVRPDITVLLGDRYETLAAAASATFDRVPIAHIHGGEATHGAMDDQIRHAVTKLSHLHFAAAGVYAERIKQMGEDPMRVWVTGAPGLDNLADMPSRTPGRSVMMTYHAETLGSNGGAEAMIEALEAFSQLTVLYSGNNKDPGSDAIDFLLTQKYGKQDFTLEEYVAACRRSAFMIGNSSSGIIEAPTMELPTVNIGTRQDGRLRARSVFDCNTDVHQIRDAITQALDYKGPWDNPCGGPGASEVIAKIIATQDLSGILVKKWHSS